MNRDRSIACAAWNLGLGLLASGIALYAGCTREDFNDCEAQPELSGCEVYRSVPCTPPAPANRLVCDTTNGTWVECLRDTDCSDPERTRCAAQRCQATSGLDN